MGVSLPGAGHDDGNDAAERWGLVWDPEEGPVWGNTGGSVEEKPDTWTQLLREGVNGIVTDRDGGTETVCCICVRKDDVIERDTLGLDWVRVCWTGLSLLLS